jgi:iron complex outermembrane receptor protein
MKRTRIRSCTRLDRCVLCLLIFAFVDTESSRAQSRTPTQSAAPQSVTGDLAQMSIEDLMNLEVTSGAKKVEPVQRTAAAIFVITSEDIRRSGATTLPDVLRMVPGLEVAQVSGNTWSISSRGFNDIFADKLLVLVDGRTIYSPVFTGVLWDAQDMLLANIERIEVIRGPGAALWGTNAVNGVINIVSKTAAKTQGATLTTGAGNIEGVYGAVQYGGKLGNNGFYRVFVKGFSKASNPGDADGESLDGWSVQHGGFRADWTLNSRDSLTVQGDLFQSSGEGTTNFTTSLSPLVFGSVPGELDNHGGDLSARWRRTFSARSEVSLQAYFDHESADAGFVSGSSNTVDVEFQHHFGIGDRHDVVWGVDYRAIQIVTFGSAAVSFTPPRTLQNLGSIFFQDEIELLPGRVRLTLGGRVQREYSTGFDFQPDARILWTPTNRQVVWLAASRALRGVSPSDTSVTALLGPIPSGSGPLIVPEALGNPNLRPEAEVAFQIGYRAEIASTFSIDAAAFFNKYTHVRGEDAGTPILETGAGDPFLLLPETADNKISGDTHGIEFAGTWKPVSVWKLSGGYTWINGTFRDGSTGAPPGTSANTLNSPHHQFSLRSSVNLPHRFELDSALYRVGPLDASGAPGYYRLDVRLGWHVGEHAEFAVVGQNLLSANHTEWANETDWFAAASIRRSYYAKMTWHFRGSPKK